MNLGVLFALLTTISFALSAFPYTFLHKYAVTTIVTFWRLVLATLFVVLLAVFFDCQQFFSIFSNHYIDAWLWIGASGIVTFLLGDYLIFESYAVLGPAKGSLLTALSPATALVFGIILLGEQINFIGILAILITIAGIILVNVNKKGKDVQSDHKTDVSKAIVFGVLGACCIGIGIALSKQGAVALAASGKSITPLSITFIRIVVPAVLFTLYIFSTKSRGGLLSMWATKEGAKLIITGTLLNPTAGIALSMYAISYMDIAVAQTIFSSSPLLSLVINIFYYKQKATRNNVIGAIVACVGVVLLIFRNSF